MPFVSTACHAHPDYPVISIMFLLLVVKSIAQRKLSVWKISTQNKHKDGRKICAKTCKNMQKHQQKQTQNLAKIAFKTKIPVLFSELLRFLRIYCIWVGFPRTGILPVLCHFFQKFNNALRRHLTL